MPKFLPHVHCPATQQLITCCEAGNLAGAVECLAQGANPDASAYQPLRIASSLGHTELVRLLLTHSTRGVSWALRYAAYAGQAEAVKVLLAAGGDIHAKNDAPLRWSAIKLHVAVVDVLLNAGADASVLTKCQLRRLRKKGLDFTAFRSAAKAILSCT